MNDEDPKRVPREIKPTQVISAAISVALEEAIVKGFLTKDGFDYIAKRTDEVWYALFEGKVLVPNVTGIYDIKTRDEMGYEPLPAELRDVLEIGGK